MPSLTQTLLAATLASLSLAITVTSPTKHQLWDSSKSNTITWSSVSTDPKTVDIYLAHMSVQPPLLSLLFSDISTSAGSAVVSNLQLPLGEAYQINLVASDNEKQILAQSQQFNVTGEAVAGATSTVDGYTGKTYVASSTKSGTATGSATRSASLTTITSASTNSNGSTVTGTSTRTDSSENAEVTESASGTGSRTVVSAASTGASSTRSGNAAPTNFATGGSVMAVMFGVAAFLV